jgi:tripartite-type tricarboxylate transporter receptor subunit TctC
MKLDRRRWIAMGAAAPWAWADKMAAATPVAAGQGVAKVLAGFPAGGSVDAVSRRLAEALQGNYARALVVDNRAGAGGRLAIEALRQAGGDGGTWLVSPADMFTIYPHIYPQLSYGWKDVAPVCSVCSFDYVWAVGPGAPDSVRTLKDYAAWVRAEPKMAAYASPAAGTPSHFIGSLFADAMRVQMTHVAYRGSAPAIQDLLGGVLPAFCTTVPDLMAYAADPRIRVLAVAAHERSPFMPQVPTFAEQGYAQLVLAPNFFLVALPRSAASTTVQTLAQAVRQALQLPRVEAALRTLGQTPDWSGPAATAQRLEAQLAHWSGIVKRTGFVAE